MKSFHYSSSQDEDINIIRWYLLINVSQGFVIPGSDADYCLCLYRNVPPFSYSLICVLSLVLVRSKNMCVLCP